jgi:sec-independent protein translocase protein TatA
MTNALLSLAANLHGPLAAIFGGGWEWIVILLIILVLFGSRLPKVARSLGSGISEFKKGLNEGEKGDDRPAAKPKSKDVDDTSV